MGEMIEFASNGGTVPGYLALPENEVGPGVIIIQEWWGLVPHIKEVCDRFARQGFVALSPDLYHGEETTEPDEAAKLMMGLKLEQALKDMGGAVEALKEYSTGGSVGVVGFCMGGGLALLLAAGRPDDIGVCVSFYGALPWEDVHPDWSAVEAVVQMHVGTSDGWASEFAAMLAPQLTEMGKEVEVYQYEGADHAFFNDHRPEVHDDEASRVAFERTVDLLKARLVPA